jgi:two-component system, OmpR family, response regulator
MTMHEDTKVFPRHQRALRSLDRWTQASGAPLLVIDPIGDGESLRVGMAPRGVNVTWVRSALDGLVEFGRTNPRAVIVSPYVSDLPAVDLIATIRKHSRVIVIACLPDGPDSDAGPLVLAGARAIVTLPYTSESVWGLLYDLDSGLDEHALTAYGPLELDVAAYTVRVRGARIPDPPPREFELLRALVQRAPEIVSDEDLAVALWGRHRSGGRDNTMSVHVRRLRTRLEGIADIRRIRGRGYALALT